MRRHGGFLYWLCAFVLLLILSALVETPASRESAAPAPNEPLALLSVALMPNTLPTREEDALRPHAAPFIAMAALAGLSAWAGRAEAPYCRDANGRWIRKKRYVDSVYQVFRQEVACG